MHRILIVCASLIILLMIDLSRAQAAFVLSTDSSNYNALQGGFVDVGLQFADADPFATTLLEQEGLQSAGGRLIAAGGNAHLLLLSITAGPGFSATSSSYYPASPFPVTNASNLAGIFANNDSLTTGVGVGSHTVTVATFRFVVTGNPGDFIVITPDQLDSRAAFAENVTFNSATNLDPQLSGNYAQATIHVVPEPGSVICFLSIAFLVTRRRRKATQKAKISL